MELDKLRRLAGITPYAVKPVQPMSGTDKAELMRKNSIKPGTEEWFQLWFSKPQLTGEKPTKT